MSIIDFIAVVSFGLTCFSIGYTLGKDNHKPQKYTSTSLITAAPPKATTAVATNCIGFGKFSNTKTFLLLLRTLLKDPVVNAAIIMTDTDTKVSQ